MLKMASPRTRWQALLLIAASFLVAAAARASEEVNKADEILENYLTAIGGREFFALQSSYYWKGRIEFKADGVHGSFEMWQEGLARVEHISAPAQPKVGVPKKFEETWGWDGTRGWKLREDGKCVSLTSEEAEPFQEPSILAEIRDYASVFAPRHFGGEAVFEGHPAFRVELGLPDGKSQTAYFDRETNLKLGGVARTRRGPSGRLVSTEILLQWPQAGPFPRHPDTIRTVSLGMEILLHTETFKFGLSTPPSWAMPCQLSSRN